MTTIFRSKVLWLLLLSAAAWGGWYYGSAHGEAESVLTRKLYSAKGKIMGPLTTEWNRLQYVRLGKSPEKGQKLYSELCASCHDGKRARAPNLAVPALPRASTDDALYDIIRRGIPKTDMRGFVSDDQEAWQLVAFVKKMGQSAPPDGATAGDRAKGRTLVGQRGCLGCHALGAEGGFTGPDLTQVGLRRSASFLREVLVDPAANASGDYHAVTVQMPGRTISGMRMGEDTFSIQLRDLSGKLHSVMKSETTAITERKDKSVMPSYASLPASELDDMVAYLSSLRGRP